MKTRNLKGSNIIRQRARVRQAGYLLLEFAFVLILSTLLAINNFAKITRALETSLAVATGQYLTELQSGVNLYILTNMSQLSISGAVTGFAVPLQPTVAELTAKGYLPASFSATSPLGLSFKNVLTLTNCPGLNCVVAGTAYSTTGYKDGTNAVRIDVLADAIQQIGVDGAMSFVATPAVLNYFGGGTQANPGGAIAGTLSIRLGTSNSLAALLTPFYMLDGSRPLAGTMNANNNDISAVKNLGVTGTATVNNAAVTNLVVSGDTSLTNTVAPGSACGAGQQGFIRKSTSGSALAICAGNFWMLLGSGVTSASDGAACATPGQFGTTPTGLGLTCNGTYWSPLLVSATIGDVCGPAGKTAISIANKEQLICMNGTFVKLTSLLAKNVEVSRVLIQDGQAVTKPTCDLGGTAAYSFLMTQTTVDVAVIPPRQAMYIAAVDMGSFWTVKIRLRDNAAGDFSATPYGISAVMKVECSY